MAAERMSRVDTSWLRMDNDVNLMMIVGVWLLQPAITLEQLRERIGDKTRWGRTGWTTRPSTSPIMSRR
jgi:hypothetical protein